MTRPFRRGHLFRVQSQAPGGSALRSCRLLSRMLTLCFPTLRGASQLGQTPLHMAAFKGHLAVTEALLADGADTEAKDNVRPAQRSPNRSPAAARRIRRFTGATGRRAAALRLTAC